MKIIETERIPIYIWADHVDETALTQAKNLANFPYSVGHIVLLPDVHTGFGIPIGCVFASDKVVIPNAVGKDIGCGMSAVRTSLKAIDQKLLKKIVQDIRVAIPLGHNHHLLAQDEKLLPSLNGLPKKGIVYREYESAKRQLGTLGSGNHFIEIQKGNDGHIWIMVHSGSRNLGKKVADHYDRVARENIKNKKEKLPGNNDLVYLDLGSGEADDYLNEMQFCIDFAFASRKYMTGTVERIFKEHIKDYKRLEFINIAHNYAGFEKINGKKCLIHRKGATSALKGEKGIIPGSQGTNSYIVEGLGNPDSFNSCSHGAGRIMGRKQAQRTLNFRYEKERLDKKGIIHSIFREKDLDEAPSAYKDISTVIKDQKELVEIKVELTPLAVVKG